VNKRSDRLMINFNCYVSLQPIGLFKKILLWLIEQPFV